MSTDREDFHTLYFPPPQRIRLDERFFAILLPETPQDRVEAQELRQIVHRALKDLTPQELRVIELRYQHKKSPGQTASRLGISREEMEALEKKGLEKLRTHLQAWYSEE